MLRRPAAWIFGGGRAEPSFRSPRPIGPGDVPPEKVRGVTRRKALVRIAAPVARLAVGAGPLSGRDRRRMTLAGAPFGASPRLLRGASPPLQFRTALPALGICACAVQRSSSRRGRSAAGAGSGTARVRKDSDALRPRGPHRPGLRFPASPAPGGRFDVAASPTPSSRFVPPWLASRKRPSVDEVRCRYKIIGYLSKVTFSTVPSASRAASDHGVTWRMRCWVTLLLRPGYQCGSPRMPCAANAMCDACGTQRVRRETNAI
jgi:hypothetical protein